MTGIVVDIGCRTYGPQQDSISELIRVYEPALILGYDLRDDIPEGVETRHQPVEVFVKVDPTVVVQTIGAAWTRHDEVRFHHEGTASRVATDGHHYIQSFDLAALVQALPPGIVMKLDVEGAEYRLIRHLLRRGVADRIAELVVEWHGDRSPRPSERGRLERDWPTVLKEWWL